MGLHGKAVPWILLDTDWHACGSVNMASLSHAGINSLSPAEGSLSGVQGRMHFDYGPVALFCPVILTSVLSVIIFLLLNYN